MNEQQLQQILTIQQAIAAAATAAVINSLLNPQQAGSGAQNVHALTDPTSNDLQQQLVDSRLQSPIASGSPANSIDSQRIQELLLQLQQQAASGASGQNNVGGISPATAAAALNLNLNNQLPIQPNLGGSPISHSPVSGRHLNQQSCGFNSLASSNNNLQTVNQITPNKKLKRHHQSPAQQFQPQTRQTLDQPPSKSQHSTPKNHSIANLSNRNSSSANTNTSSSPSSSAFLTNNVGLPRKLVRGQDVWLGRGAEQTRQILKCMWCGQSFRTLAEMTQHMKVTQHYTNIISQEQITSWRQPEGSDPKSGKQSSQQARSLDDNHDDLSDRFNDSDRDDSFSNDDEIPQQQQKQQQPQQRASKSRSRQSTAIKRELNSTLDNLSSINSSKEDTSPPKHSKESPSSLTLTSSQQQQHSSKTKALTGGSGSGDNEDDESKRASSPAIEDVKSPASESSSSQVRLGSIKDEEIQKFELKSELAKDTKLQGHSSKLGEESDRAQREIEPKVSSDDEDQKNDEESKANGEAKTKLEIDSREEHENQDQRKQTSTHEEESSNDEEDVKASKQDEERRMENDNVNKVDDDDDDDDEDDNDDDGNNDHDDDRDERERLDDDDPLMDKLAPRKRGKRKDDEEILAHPGGRSDSSDVVAGPKGLTESGDPLSALETMVEKSFDPRLRPGVANGGILQRLGIDEEVCPPWQHLNYANWYAAAAYGHPMAAALLAAGINLQNGIKLSKNVTPKKEDD